MKLDKIQHMSTSLVVGTIIDYFFCEIPPRLERRMNILYKDMETSPF